MQPELNLVTKIIKISNLLDNASLLYTFNVLRYVLHSMYIKFLFAGRQRVLNKLVQSSHVPVNLIEKLSPLASQYIVPFNSKTLTRRALIMFNTAGRAGANEEAKVLSRGLTHVGFNVTSHEWSQTTELLESIKSSLAEFASSSSVIFLGIMTHGSHGTLRGASGSEVSVNQIMMLTNSILPHSIPTVSQ